MDVLIRPATADEDSIRDRAARLFHFLAELTAMRVKKIRDLSSYESFFWFHELPDEPEVYSHTEATIRDDESWLRIDKAKKPKLDAMPTVCAGWYDTEAMDNFGEAPTLREERIPPIIQPNDETNSEFEPQQLTDAPHVQEAWDAFLTEKWQPWSKAMQRWELVQGCYRKLFAMYQEQERRGEQYELLVGVGSLLWTDRSDRRICRPILTTRATLSLEAISGRIELNPSEDGAEIKLEQDMLDPSDQPTKECQTEVEKRITELESLWERSPVCDVLKEWFGSLAISGDGSFHDSLNFERRISEVPQMAFAPVLILRKRQGSANGRDTVS